MQGHVWYRLLRHVPAEHHHQLMLVTVAGTEIAFQSILRIEEEFLVIKGRLAGSQDAGRVFFMPFRSIDYLGFQNAMREEEFEALFGNLTFVDSQTPPPLAQPEPEPEAAAEPEASQAPVGPSNKTPLPIKSAVLERFRSRNLSGPA
jgi:hypothetical protein